jgi:hypothetical protein
MVDNRTSLVHVLSTLGRSTRELSHRRWTVGLDILAILGLDTAFVRDRAPGRKLVAVGPRQGGVDIALIVIVAVWISVISAVVALCRVASGADKEIPPPGREPPSSGGACGQEARHADRHASEAPLPR